MSEGFFSVSHGNHYDIVQDNRGGIQKKLSQSTTIISGYAISINGGDPTKIDVASGVFSEELAGVTPVPPATSNLSNPISNFIKTDAFSAVAIDGIATDGYTVFQIDINGDIIQTLNGVPSQESENMSPKIAVIVHAGGAVLSAESWWTVGQNPSKRVSWLMGKLGILKEGITAFGATAANLQFAHDSGVLSYAGADGDKYPKNPDEQPVSAQDPVAGFILAKQDAFISFAQTAIDPTQIDVGGTLTALTGNGKVSIQRIMINLNGTFTVQYGQNAYATLEDGLSALTNGTDTFVKFGVISKVSRICAYLIIDRTCTDLTNTSLAQFVQTGLLESDGGISATSELVTLLKALQNGNSGDGVLQVKNIGDGTDAQDAVTVAQALNATQYQIPVADASSNLQGYADFVRDASGNIIIGTGNPQGTTTSVDVIGNQTNQAADSIIAELNLMSDPSSGSIGSSIRLIKGADNQKDSLAFCTGSTVLLHGLVIDYLGNLTAPEMTNADIQTASNQALITKGYLGELHITIPAGVTVNVTSSNATNLNNEFIAYASGMPDTGMEISEVSFGTTRNLGSVAGTTPFEFSYSTLSNGYGFVNSSTSSREIAITIKALGETDIDQLIVS